MKLVKAEGYQDSLINVYRDLIQEAIVESETEHKTRIDLGRLNSRLAIIQKAAKCDGLSDDDIDELINTAVPISKVA